MSRVDILISASAPDCSRAPVNKKRNRKRVGKRGGEEPESAGKKSEKRERDRAKVGGEGYKANDC